MRIFLVSHGDNVWRAPRRFPPGEIQNEDRAVGEAGVGFPGGKVDAI